MIEYRVTWIIDIEADNPVEAAAKALTIQRDSDSSASVFEVHPLKGPDTDPWTIDLNDPDSFETSFQLPDGTAP